MYHPTPLMIPKDLQKDLPFKDTPKILKAKRDPVRRVVVIREPKEAKVSVGSTVRFYINRVIPRSLKGVVAAVLTTCDHTLLVQYNALHLLHEGHYTFNICG